MTASNPADLLIEAEHLLSAQNELRGEAEELRKVLEQLREDYEQALRDNKRRYAELARVVNAATEQENDDGNG